MSDAAINDSSVTSPEPVDPGVTMWGDRKDIEIEDKEILPVWAANARRYEWSDEFGDVGPEDKELEKLLFADDNKMEVGDHLEKLTDIKVLVESQSSIEPIVKFDDAGLHPVVRQNVHLCGFKIPTPIQAYCLPAVLKNLDVIGIAQTGISANAPTSFARQLTSFQDPARQPRTLFQPSPNSWAKRRSFAVPAQM